jgi:hypothetical protein
VCRQLSDAVVIPDGRADCGSIEQVDLERRGSRGANGPGLRLGTHYGSDAVSGLDKSGYDSPPEHTRCPSDEDALAHPEPPPAAYEGSSGCQ